MIWRRIAAIAVLLIDVGCARYDGSVSSPDGKYILDVVIIEAPATARDTTSLQIRRPDQRPGNGVAVGTFADGHSLRSLSPEWVTDGQVSRVRVHGPCEDYLPRSEARETPVKIECVQRPRK